MASSGLDMRLVGVLIVLLVIVVAAIFYFSSSNSGTVVNNKGGSSGTGSSTNTGGLTPTGGSGSGTSGSGTSSASLTKTSKPVCGAGNYCLSSSDLFSLLGTGTYNSTYTNDSYTIGLATGAGTRNSTYLTGNVTAIYVVAYTNITRRQNPNVTGTAVEFVYQTPVAKSIYAKAIQTSPYKNLFNATNATSNGMTYSISSQSNAYYAGTTLIGYKNNAVVEFIVIGAKVSSSQLLSTVSGDMP